MKYLFGKQKANGTYVPVSTLYGGGNSYGFIGQNNMFNPDLSNDFTLPSYLAGENITDYVQDDEGVYIDSKDICARIDAEKGRLIPVCFMSDVPEYGNYKITCTLKGDGIAMVFCGTRRLVFRNEIKKELTISFIQNAGKIIPRGFTEVYERKHVNVTVLGENIKLSEIAIEPVECQVLYICGDSTVTDQSADIPYAPGTSYSGWGQMFPGFIKGIAVSNHAHSGLTTESMRSEGHYGIIEECIKPGDYICYQFAHNDQKLSHLMAYGGYKERMVNYINEAREKGAYPFLITPFARNTWKADGTGYNDLLKEYAECIIKTGEEYNAPVVDLHDYSMKEVMRDGLESSKRYYFPKDYTHANDYGAYKMAGFIAKSMQKFSGEYKKLSDSISFPGLTWDNDEIPVLPVIPERFVKNEEAADNNGLFANLERPNDLLTRAEALDIVIKTCRFFPTNVFNDLYDDIVGHEWYAGAVQCAYQNGLIAEGMTSGKLFRPTEYITTEDFLCFLIAGYRSRKRMPEEKECPFDADTCKYSKTFVRAAWTLGAIKADDILNSKISRRRAADICLSLNI